MITKKYRKKSWMNNDINNMREYGWRVVGIRRSRSKTLGCSGCCILPLPLISYSREYEVDFDKEGKKDDNKDNIALRQEYDATKKPK